MKHVMSTAVAVALSLYATAQEQADSAKIDILLLPNVELNEVNVLGTWAQKDDPIAQINLTEKAIEALNTGRDLPYVLQDVAGVVSFSDAGNGVGYTNMRVRGSDITRINVTVNGIPMNDAESHGVFWVNTPDLMSSTNAIQLQKGVGTSTNGSGAFGASLGLSTLGAGEKGGRITLGAGSYGTQRATMEAGTGKSASGFWMNTRISSITSDGYVERASSDLQSYYVSAGFAGGGHYVEAVRFGGGERTYQAWYGVDSTTMYGPDAYPQFNAAGALYDDAWSVIGTYDDQVDNYGQEHTQLHYRYSNLFGGTFAAALHYTAGAGYYEEYNQGFAFADFGISNYVSAMDTVTFGDVVSRKWLDNDFYGATSSWTYENGDQRVQLGGGVHRYEGAHFGRVIWANNPNVSTLDGDYYTGDAIKDDANIYAKYALTSNNLLVYADAQYRYVNHSSTGGSATGPANFDRTFNFFNPKVGMTYNLGGNQILGAYAGVGHREPNRTDLQYADDANSLQAERMLDMEFNFRNSGEKWAFDVNAYRQQYQNQLVLTGAIDAQGYPIRENVGQSLRQGVEFTGAYELTTALSATANVALSQNENVNWVSDPLSSFVDNTSIAFSPGSVASARLTYTKKGFEATLWNQYVGKQYMSNEGLDAHSLPAYHIINARTSYTWNCSDMQRLIGFVEFRNLGNTSYAANGYMWGDFAYYYAQATFNVMTGLTFEF
ncbi:MAG: TonB-dependent receptor plug domain-containing protein [Schleiferiaceae bacterium]|nr:TonB-dependent receptor plug domain-containing protein [Schleiferiaceae bacterium]